MNAVEVHGSQRNGVRWLYELVAIRSGSVVLVLVDNAFNRGGPEVRRRVIEERVSAVEGTAGNFVLVEKVCIP